MKERHILDIFVDIQRVNNIPIVKSVKKISERNEIGLFDLVKGEKE